MVSELTVKDFKEDIHVDWCPGCGDFGVLSAVQMALADLGRQPHEVAVFSGIGCSGKTSHYVKTYGVHTLHGRVLPFATGAKLANPGLEVVAVGGDGDGYGIGAGHFVNAGRRNLDMAYVVFDNQVYGLTKGQASPTLGRGKQTKSLPTPNIQDGVNPLVSAIAAGYTWVGRGYSFDIKGLKKLILAAIEHKGAALLDVLQPCPTYNNLQDREFYTPRVYDLADDGYDGRVRDGNDEAEVRTKKAAALTKSLGTEKFPLGVFYEVRLETFEERMAARLPRYPKVFPADGSWVKDGKPTGDIFPMLKTLRVA
jgi:2-oxoglutarate/2-oxoacid ferredoxin oxidoreductase subunit beta